MKVALHPTGHVPWDLAASGDLPIKTDKAKLVHALIIGHFEKQSYQLVS